MLTSKHSESHIKSDFGRIRRSEHVTSNVVLPYHCGVPIDDVYLAQHDLRIGIVLKSKSGISKVYFTELRDVLYSFPSIALKSSATAIDAKHTIKNVRNFILLSLRKTVPAITL
jgi:hypothetical protein